MIDFLGFVVVGLFIGAVFATVVIFWAFIPTLQRVDKLEDSDIVWVKKHSSKDLP